MLTVLINSPKLWGEDFWDWEQRIIVIIAKVLDENKEKYIMLYIVEPNISHFLVECRKLKTKTN